MIVIAGPPAAGKTTVAEMLADKYPKSAQFSVDTIRHFIKGGNIPPWETGDAAEKQIKLGDAIVGDIVKRYVDSGYVVILDGVYSDEDLEEYRSQFSEVHGFLLLPPLDVLRDRDGNRDEYIRMPHRLEPLHKAYSEQDNKLFETIDNSGQSVEETVDYIYQVVSSGM